MSNIVDKLDALIDSRLPQTPEAISRRKNRLIKPLGIAAGIGVAIGGSLGLGILVSNAVDTRVAQNQQINDQYENQRQDGGFDTQP